MLELTAYMDMGASTRNIMGSDGISFIYLFFKEEEKHFGIKTPDISLTCEISNLSLNFISGLLHIKPGGLTVLLENDSIYGMMENHLLYGENQIGYHDANTILEDMKSHGLTKKTYKPWLLFFNENGYINHADDIIEDFKINYRNSREEY